MKIQTLHSGILILAFSCIYQFGNAQIVYTDVNPDTTIISCGYNGCSATYNLNLNNDGASDFELVGAERQVNCSTCGRGTPHTTDTLRITPASYNSVANSGGYCSALTSSQSINSSLTFLTIIDQILAEQVYSHCSEVSGQCIYAPEGNWVDETDRYLGLQIKVGTDFYFGWARLNVTGGGVSFTIKDYAYNSIPNQSILAGQTCPPQALIIANGAITLCAGDSVILSSANSGTNLSYKWKLNGSNIHGATNKNYTAKAAGKYRVQVTDNTNGCSASSNVVKVKVSCKTTNESDLADASPAVSIYPNPFSQSTTISFTLSQSQNVLLQIYDVTGRLVTTLADEDLNAGTHQLQWNATDDNGKAVSAGIYLLKMAAANSSESIRLSVMR